MKKTLVLIAFVLFSMTTFGQTLNKGTLIGFHTTAVQLLGTTTMQEYYDYLTNKWAPAMGEALSCEVRILKFVKGKDENKIGFMLFFKNENDWKNNLSKESNLAKAKALFAEMDKYAKRTDEFTDWIVQ